MEGAPGVSRTVQFARGETDEGLDTEQPSLGRGGQPRGSSKEIDSNEMQFTERWLRLKRHVKVKNNV